MKWNLKVLLIATVALLMWVLLQDAASDSKVLQDSQAMTSDGENWKAENIEPISDSDAHLTNTRLKKTTSGSSEAKSIDKISKSDADKNTGSYVEAYRTWRYFDNCYTDVEDVVNEVDPLETMKQRMDSNQRESQEQSSQRQQDMYMQHFENCKAIMDEDRDFYTIKARLENEMITSDVETQEEKDLQHAQELKQQLEQSYYQMRMSRRGRVDTDESRLVQHQIDAMYADVTMIYESAETLSEEDNEIIQSIMESISELKKKLLELQTPDKPQVDAQVQLYRGMVNTAHDFLTNNVSSDAFLLLAPEIYQKKETSLAIEQIKQNLGIYDLDYIRLLSQIAIPIFACEMGQPCDAESEWSLSHCLGLKDAMFDQACEKSLHDFYWGYYIGPNQSVDVQRLLNHFRSVYELHR